MEVEVGRSQQNSRRKRIGAQRDAADSHVFEVGQGMGVGAQFAIFEQVGKQLHLQSIALQRGIVLVPTDRKLSGGAGRGRVVHKNGLQILPVDRTTHRRQSSRNGRAGGLLYVYEGWEGDNQEGRVGVGGCSDGKFQRQGCGCGVDGVVGNESQGKERGGLV